MPNPTKFLLVGFDGLRPDMITASLMPNLYQFGLNGVTFNHHRSSFPTETYVNLPSLVTGTTPSRHGMIANRYLDPHVDPCEPFEGFSVAKIEKSQKAYQGQLYGAPSLGEILQSAQRRMAVISTNSPGSVRLKHHQVFDHNHLSMACHNEETSYPHDQVSAIVNKLGHTREKTIPDFSGTSYATQVFLEHVCQGELPDITLLWYGEPDESYHRFGIGSPQNIDVLKHVDAEFGRLLHWWETSDVRESLQIVVTSDHGHITQKTKVNMGERLQEAGFKVGDHLQDGADLALIAAYSGGIWVRDNNPALVRKVAHTLMNLEECGTVFSSPKNEVDGIAQGSFSRALVMADHARSPDIYYTLKTSDEPNQFGYSGSCYFQSGLPVGGSIHGGLHAKELASVCLAAGTLFAEKHSVTLPSGIFDIAPTILHSLGIAAPEGMQGRILHEGFIKPATEVALPVPEQFEAHFGPYQQVLARTKLGSSCYLDEGWREC